MNIQSFRVTYLTGHINIYETCKNRNIGQLEDDLIELKNCYNKNLITEQEYTEAYIRRKRGEFGESFIFI